MSASQPTTDPTVCEIPLGQGRVALVDAADARFLRLFTWRPVTYGSDKWYAVTRAPALKRDVMMHRIITAAEDGSHVDHINNDGLDNRRANLRIATPAQNAANRRPRRGASSRFKGVSWNKADRRWIARIYDEGRDRTVGRFLSEVAAARAYNRAAKVVYGEFAYLNPVPGPGGRAGRHPRPWFWKARDVWCVEIDRKRHILARGEENESLAIKAFNRLVPKIPSGAPRA